MLLPRRGNIVAEFHYCCKLGGQDSSISNPRASVSERAKGEKATGSNECEASKDSTSRVSNQIMQAAGTSAMPLFYVAQASRARALEEFHAGESNRYKKHEQILPQFRVPGKVDDARRVWSAIDKGTWC